MVGYVEQLPSVSAKREREGRAATPSSLTAPLSQSQSKVTSSHLKALQQHTLHTETQLSKPHQTSDVACIQVSSCHNCNHSIYWHSDCVHACVYAQVLRENSEDCDMPDIALQRMRALCLPGTLCGRQRDKSWEQFAFVMLFFFFSFFPEMHFVLCMHLSVLVLELLKTKI